MVICKRKSAEMATRKCAAEDAVVDSACLDSITNKTCFETGRIVYLFGLVCEENFHCEHCYKLNKITKHNLVSRKVCNILMCNYC